MNKLIFALLISATAVAALPANAQSAQSTLKVGDKCFKPTDSSRGFGYWTSCDKVYAFVIARQPTLKITNAPDLDVDRSADGGGGDGGGNR